MLASKSRRERGFGHVLGGWRGMRGGSRRGGISWQDDGLKMGLWVEKREGSCSGRRPGEQLSKRTIGGKKKS